MQLYAPNSGTAICHFSGKIVPCDFSPPRYGLSETQIILRSKYTMVRIRLRRIGLKGQPTYRLVAADKEAPRDGRFLEILGVYNPRTNPATIHLKEDRIFHWMKNGALPTESVAQIFKSSGTQERFERLKKGESIESLVAEAAAAEIKRAAPVRTSKA
jgi:small subunit ribosomal protein S16